MKVRVDLERCESNALCVALAPDVFDLDDEGMAVVVGDVTDGNLEKVRTAVASCPKTALSMEA